jgi:hypothetical protein
MIDPVDRVVRAIARRNSYALVVRSLGSSLGDLQRATERVRAGDYGARVPVVATGAPKRGRAGTASVRD